MLSRAKMMMMMMAAYFKGNIVYCTNELLSIRRVAVWNLDINLSFTG